MNYWQAILKQTTDREFMTRLWRLALPVSLQSMMFSLLGLIDIMMVSQLGTTAVAAVGLGNRVFFFNLLVIAGLAGGVSVLAAQYFGRGEMAGVRRSLALAIVGALLVTLPFAFIYVLSPGSVLGFASQDPALRELADQFLMITGATILCTAIVVPLESALRSVGNAAAPTRIGIIAIIANVILNYALIFGHFGFEAMGVAGSAWGTTISRLLQTTLLLLYVKRYEARLIPRAPDWLAAFKRKEVVRFTLIALPLLFHDGLWAFGMLIYGFLYAHLGTDSLAIMTTLGTLESILISLFFGLAVACSTLLGHRLGAEEYEVAWQHSQLFLLLAPIGALLVGIIVWLLQANLLQWVGNLPPRADDGSGSGARHHVSRDAAQGVQHGGDHRGTSLWRRCELQHLHRYCRHVVHRHPARLGGGHATRLAPLLGGGSSAAGGAQQGVAGASPYSPALLVEESGDRINSHKSGSYQ